MPPVCTNPNTTFGLVFGGQVTSIHNLTNHNTTRDVGQFPGAPGQPFTKTKRLQGENTHYIQNSAESSTELASVIFTPYSCPSQLPRFGRVSPTAWQYINFHGRFDFLDPPTFIDLESVVQELAQGSDDTYKDLD